MTEKDEIKQIQAALMASRDGGASIPQLVTAHELAEKHQMPATLAELRKHIRDLIPNPNNSAIALGRTVGLGMLTGLLTFFVIRYITRRANGGLPS